MNILNADLHCHSCVSDGTLSPETLAARVLRQEHVIYPRAVRWFLDGKLVIEGAEVRVKDEKAGNDAQMVVAAD